MQDTSEWKLHLEKVTSDSAQYPPSEFPGSLIGKQREKETVY